MTLTCTMKASGAGIFTQRYQSSTRNWNIGFRTRNKGRSILGRLRGVFGHCGFEREQKIYVKTLPNRNKFNLQVKFLIIPFRGYGQIGVLTVQHGVRYLSKYQIFNQENRYNYQSSSSTIFHTTYTTKNIQNFIRSLKFCSSEIIKYSPAKLKIQENLIRRLKHL